MPIACKYCILVAGIKGSAGPGLFATDEDLFRHMEAAHGIIVRRDGETDREAIARYNQEFGARNDGHLEYRCEEVVVSPPGKPGKPGKSGKTVMRHFIWDTHLDYCVVELLGDRAAELGKPIAMILDWLKIEARPPKECRRAHNLARARGQKKSKKF